MRQQHTSAYVSIRQRTRADATAYLLVMPIMRTLLLACTPSMYDSSCDREVYEHATAATERCMSMQQLQQSATLQDNALPGSQPSHPRQHPQRCCRAGAQLLRRQYLCFCTSKASKLSSSSTSKASKGSTCLQSASISSKIITCRLQKGTQFRLRRGTQFTCVTSCSLGCAEVLSLSED